MKYIKTLICILFLAAIVSCKKAEEPVPADVKDDPAAATSDTPKAAPVGPELKGVKESEKDE